MLDNVHVVGPVIVSVLDYELQFAIIWEIDSYGIDYPKMCCVSVVLVTTPKLWLRKINAVFAMNQLQKNCNRDACCACQSKVFYFI